MDPSRKHYSKFREVLMDPKDDDIVKPSNEKKNAYIKNHKPSQQPKKSQNQPNAFQQQSFVVDSSIISALPKFPKSDIQDAQRIVTQQKDVLEIYKEKIKNKNKGHTFKLSTMVQIESNLKMLANKIQNLTQNIELAESKSSLNLKSSSTFNSDLVTNLNKKKNHLQSYQNNFQRDNRQRVVTQYDKLKQICRPDMLRTHRRVDSGSHQKNIMIRSVLSRQKSEELFNKADLHRFLNKQKQKKVPSLNLGNLKFSHTHRDFNPSTARNFYYTDVQNQQKNH